MAEQLSSVTKSLWGKISVKERSWLPLYIHLYDTGKVAELLWEYWLPEGTRQIIVRGIADESYLEMDRTEYAKRVVVFLAMIHDIGKASPCFQIKAKDIGYTELLEEIILWEPSVKEVKRASNTKLYHALISQNIMMKQGLDKSYATVLGGHHGKPPQSLDEIESVDRYSSTGVKSEKWKKIHCELVAFALQYSGLVSMPRGVLSIAAQSILTGVVIMADWIASGDGFPLISLDEMYKVPQLDEERAEKALDKIGLPFCWTVTDDWKMECFYKNRFNIDEPRPVQLCVKEAIGEADNPGIVIIEAPMGEGKTEAALVAEEIMAYKHGSGGVYFALPTQATSDGIFGRIKQYAEQLVFTNHADRTIYLAHGKAGFNEEYQGIKMKTEIYNYDGAWESEAVIVNSWTQGKKKGILSDIVIGTIDQILMGGLKQKHLALRHLALANKVVIIDECHAYDAYMSSYLKLVLTWLGEYQVPVIILSATLPCSKRKELINAYLQKSEDIEEKKIERWEVNESYPLVTYTDGSEVKQKESDKSARRQEVEIHIFDEKRIAEELKDLLSEGGCAGIIRNTVKSAQDTARFLQEYFGEEIKVYLLHSRFISEDRIRKEKEVRDLLGPPREIEEEQRPHKMIVVGTQVMEQSLDVDFDVMFTDICPMDLLLQRIGRLHRHQRQHARPRKLKEAMCFVLGVNSGIEFEGGAEAIYGKYLLMKTYALLPEKCCLPEDISRLVQMTYEDKYVDKVLEKLIEKVAEKELVQNAFCEGEEQHKKRVEKKEGKAKTYQIKTPERQSCPIETLIGWLNADAGKDASGKRGEATVRDIEESLEVLLIQRKADGKLYTLPWIKQYAEHEIKIDEGVDAEIAKVIARCSLLLPRQVVNIGTIDVVIESLEKLAINHELDRLYSSHWLDGELFLVLDENLQMEFRGYLLEYSEQYGLQVKEGVDG